MKRALLVLVTCCLGALGCGSADVPPEHLGVLQEPVSAPLAQAYCSITVQGKGSKDLENDYLPRVIQCENGGANLQALKAQAIAARSVAYYNIATSGSICDSQGCQVYSCGATPLPIHHQAVKETAGMYLSYAATLTYGFYVAGSSNASAPSCAGSGGSTEKYVTYNEGKTGTAVKQTSLGYVGPPGFGQNRGCMSQWGARCLENQKGYDYKKILQFYYGADIQILKATGACTSGCEPKSCQGTKIVSDCGVGDCAAYGATCVNDSLGVRCASVFCPAQGTKKVCVNDKLIGDCSDGAISTGDCSVYGAKCVDDNLGARCVSVFCPDKGAAKSCLDDSRIIDCKDGAITGEGDCGKFGAFCSKAGGSEARCVSVFCVADPSATPVAHDICLPDGRLAHCNAQGGVESPADCPADAPCTADSSGARCGSEPAPGGGGQANDGGQAGDGSGGQGGSGGSGAGDHSSSSHAGTRVDRLGDEGCSVGPAPSGPGRAWPWLLLAAGALVHRRRRPSWR
ncbi:MAG: hypothetical protein KF718_09020 [Polyangiaceae bacterium]|nr:hypothetical protein [Polyangiaceae bacterium]